MPGDLRDRLSGKLAVHSARAGYAPSGMYGDDDQRGDRSMDIRPSETAMATQLHPIVRAHPETGRLGLYGCVGYVIGIDGLGEDEGRDLIMEWYAWQTREEFWYRHEWAPGMLVMWDNRSVLHRAPAATTGSTGCSTARPSARPDARRQSPDARGRTGGGAAFVRMR